MSNSHIQQPVWHPDQMMKRRDNLGRRAEMIRAIREYFWEQDFIECETPALQTSPGLEPHLQSRKRRQGAMVWQDAMACQLLRHTER